MSKVEPDLMGLNPAMRHSIVNAVFSEIWPEGASAAAIDKLREKLKRNLKALSALAPNSGAYLNQVRANLLIPYFQLNLLTKASLYEPNPKQTFFGSHYQKLRAIKHKYDPSDLFVVVEGVGSDEWDGSLNCRL